MALAGVAKTFFELGPELAAAFQFRRKQGALRQDAQAVNDLAVDVTTPGLLSDTDSIFYRFGRRRAMSDDRQAISSQEWGTADFRRVKARAEIGE